MVRLVLRLGSSRKALITLLCFAAAGCHLPDQTVTVVLRGVGSPRTWEAV